MPEEGEKNAKKQQQTVEEKKTPPQGKRAGRFPPRTPGDGQTDRPTRPSSDTSSEISQSELRRSVSQSSLRKLKSFPAPKKKKNKLNRKHKDSTPKGSASPNASAEQLVNDGVSPLRQALLNDEIIALQIKDVDLKKVHDSCLETTIKNAEGLPANPVVIRRTKPPSETKNPLLAFNVSHEAPPNAITEAPNIADYAGPKFDADGKIIPHSILGDVDDFIREAERRGDRLPGGVSAKEGSAVRGDEISDSRSPSVMTWKRPRTTSGLATPLNPLLNENKALDNYKAWLNKRRLQQRHLCDITNRSSCELAMNQGEAYRAQQERRALVDRALPAFERGKGWRVDSEFWAQNVWVGGEENGIYTTLTATEQGKNSAFEHVVKSRAIQKEQGVAPLDAAAAAAATSASWKKGAALPASAGGKRGRKAAFEEERLAQLAERMHQVDPVMDANLADIVVVGNGKDNNNNDGGVGARMGGGGAAVDFGVGEEDGVSEIMSPPAPEENFRLLDAFPDVKPAPIIGPSISFAGISARWTGDDRSHRGETAHEARLNFTTGEGDRDSSSLTVANDGTTAIYFNWKKLFKPNHFDIRREKVQRFYFNAQNGVILPGDSLTLDVTFKSPGAGIFSESWDFETKPVVAGGANLVMTLRGVCIKEDVNKAGREAIEAELRRRHHEAMARRILYDLVGSLTVAERPHSPIDAYLTEQQIFVRKNPGFYWNYEAIYELKYLYMSYFPEDQRVSKTWDFSLDTLKRLMLDLDEDDERKHVFLQRLNRCIVTLSFPPFTPKQKHMYSIVYQLLLEMTDAMVSQSMLIRSTMGLPEKDTAEELPDSELFGRESGKARYRHHRRRHAQSSASRDSEKKGASGSGKKRSKEMKDSSTTSKPKTVKEESPDARADANTTPNSGSAALDGIDPNLISKYKDKLYIQTYMLMTETFERMDDMCGEIRDVEQKSIDSAPIS